MFDSIFVLFMYICIHGSVIAGNIMGEEIDDRLSLVLGSITTSFVLGEKFSFFINGAVCLPLNF